MGHRIAWRGRKLALAAAISSLLGGMAEDGMGCDIAKDDPLPRRVAFFSLL
jgi:hypothetical protein